MSIIKQYSEKKIQGDGSEGWICEEWENGELINKYMVYEDPNAQESLVNKAERLITELQIVLNELKKIKL